MDGGLVIVEESDVSVPVPQGLLSESTGRVSKNELSECDTSVTGEQDDIEAACKIRDSGKIENIESSCENSAIGRHDPESTNNPTIIVQAWSSKSDPAKVIVEDGRSETTWAANERSISEAEVSKRSMSEAEACERSISEEEASERSISEAEASERSISEAEVSKRSISEAEVSKRSMSEAEACERSMSEAEVSKRSMSEAEASERSISEAEASERSMSEVEARERSISEAEASERSISEAEACERSISEVEARERSISEAEVSKRSISEAEACERSISKAEVSDRSISETEVSDRSISETEAEARGRSSKLAQGDLDRQTENNTTELKIKQSLSENENQTVMTDDVLQQKLLCDMNRMTDQITPWGASHTGDRMSTVGKKFELVNCRDAVVAETVHFNVTKEKSGHSQNKNLIVNTKRRLSSFDEQGHVVTRATKAAVKILERKNKIMITGDSKQGKKTLVNYLARRFSQGKYSQYIPVDLLSPDHWFQLLPNERHLVILDDFLGGSESTDTYWRRVLEQILDQVEEGNVVLIMSCQDVKKSEYIQKQLEPHIFDESFLVDLVSDRFQIKQFEQVSILGKMLQKHKIIVSKKELACICEQGIPSAFFACCEYFTKHVKTQNLTTNFFINPWQMFLPKIRSYLQENKPLFFTLLREGLADVVDISPELAEDISTYAKERSQFPDFFSTGNESLKFKHKCFRICIFLALYDLDPKMMVRICPLDILVEYTTTKQKNQDGKLKISQDIYHDLSKRFQGHLETDLELTLSHDYFLDCQLLSQDMIASLRLMNPVLLIRHAIRCGTTGLVKFCVTDRDLDDGYQENMHELLHESLESLNFEISNFILERGESFCDLCFLHVCKSQKKLKNPSIDLQLELHDIEGLPTNVLKLSFEELFTRGYTDAIMYIISRLEHRRDFPDLREFLINESCKYGHQNVYFCLKPKLDFFPSRDTLLSYASEGGCCEIVDDLLQMGADPNYMAHPVYTSLHLASKGNRFSIAEKLLEYGAEIKTVSKQKENVLHLASNVSKGIPPKLLIWFLREFSDMVSIYSKDAYGRTPLHIASASGNILAIKQLIGAGGHVSAHDSGGNTPLHCLVMGDNPDPETINYLVEKGADIDARNGNGETALQQLVKKGKGDDRCEVLHYMISKTKELDSFDNNGEFLLHSLLSHGCNFEEAEILIEGGCSVNARDIEDNTVLHLLASLGNERLTKVAIEKGASLLARNVKGETTLHRAVCVPNNMPVVELLMTGCQESLVAVDKFDNTPLHSACSVSVEQSELYISRLTESQPCLVNKGNYQKRTALHLAAASNGDSALTNVGLLLQADANMSKDVFDSLPLHLTCLSCGPLSPQIIQVLQMHGADVNVQNRKGNLPLHEALVSEGPNKENVVISLICYKSKLLSTNNEGLTPVDLAINNGDLEIAMTLTNAVISAACRSRHYNGHELLRLMRHVEFLDRNNESLLHKVCEISGKYTSELIKELVQNGCKVNIKDTNGRTPLHVACKMAGKHSVGIVKQLLAQGADANDKDNDRNNALHFACTAKSDQTPAIVQILYDNKASVDERSRDGDTPLHKACKLGGSELSSLIKALMNCGADMEIYNECGLRPLDIIQQLSDAPDILGVLHSAKLLNLCSRGVELNESKTRYLLKQGASLDYTNRDGDTCLHEICKQNGKYTVKNAQLLLSLGADPHAQNNNELTPYDLAVFSGNYKVSEIVHEKQQTTEIKRTKSSPREKVRPIDTISKVINIIDESYTTSQKIVKKAGEACADEDEDLNEIVKLAGTSLKFGKKLTKGGKKVTEFFERFFEEDNSD